MGEDHVAPPFFYYTSILVSTKGIIAHSVYKAMTKIEVCKKKKGRDNIKKHPVRDFSMNGWVEFFSFNPVRKDAGRSSHQGGNYIVSQHIYSHA